MKTSKPTCVMIPVYGESDYLVRCVGSILKHTALEIPIYVCDDASPYRSVEEFLIEEGIDTNRIKFIRRQKNLGFLENCNLFFAEVKNTNIVLVNSDILVSYDWLNLLLAPLSIFSNVATVTAMSNFGSIATVKLGKEELPELDESELDALNRKMQANAAPKNAEIPVGVGHCILITAEALEVVGFFDKLFNPGYGEEVDFSIRATKFGFRHYLANTVVTHFGSKTYGEKSTELKLEHDQLVNIKHPGYLDLVKNSNNDESDIESMFLNVLSKYRGLKVLIDARMMNFEGTGTSRLVENTLKVLFKQGDLQVTILFQEESIDYWKKILPPGVNLISKSELKDKGYIFDVLYSPSQISEETTILEYRFWARRVVVQQLDFIAYENWKYFASIDSFNSYRNAIIKTYEYSDTILYISRYVWGRAEYLFERNSLNDGVVYCGIDHFSKGIDPPYENNRILVIGAGFAHKNQMYALRLFELLQTRIMNPKLVYVGPKPTFGFDEEFWCLIENKTLNPSIEYYQWLSDDELKVQIGKAHLVLYPTTSEGFGFIPFEAMKMQRASIFSLNTSLGEFFENIPSKLVYSLDKDVETIHKLLVDESTYQSQLRFIEGVGDKYTWDKVGASLSDAFQSVILSKRFSSNSGGNSPTNLDIRLYFLKYFASRKLVTIFFPFFSKRRNKLISVTKKIFLNG
jgi:GT2 family glycosyltransferase